MLGIKDQWQILKTGNRADFLTIAAIMGIFILIVALNIMFIFRMTAEQTEKLGQMQLENIRSDLQGSIDAAERMALNEAVRAERLLATGATVEELEKFFEHEQREQKLLSNGECFNVYAACREWTIIPDFPNMPDDFVATERNWYKGAIQNEGKIYITEPYVDAAGHGLCFTVSLMLSDKNTVVALDFNFFSAQQSIRKLDTDTNRTALIVTKDGMIIGCANEGHIGHKLSKKMPEYQRILDTVLISPPHRSFQTEIKGRSNTVFFSETNNGWHMILCVDDNALYRDDYRHLLLNSAVNIWMILVIVFYYFRGMRSRLQAEKALRVKEEFLQGLSKELHAPLQKILKLSNVGAMGDEENLSENTAQIRESALKLSEMLNNLFSFSNIVTENEKTLEKRADRNLHLSKVSQTARQRIIAVLTIALIIRIGISIYTNIGWGDTKMTHEVEAYEHRLSNWIVEQKTVLSMFANVISEHPEFMDDYPAAVKFLNGIVKNYPEISACYMANPNKPHQLIMNNGWESPDPAWRVESRPWYIETEAAKDSRDGFTVSTPYIDSRTGNYCVTIAKIVYSKSGEFLGMFGIDFYLDRLIQILDASYTGDSYAFLVDKKGQILNHPNAAYQMTHDKITSITTTEYKNVYENGEDFWVKDFRDNRVTCIAKKNKPSGFTVVVADSWQDTYGQLLWFTASFVVIYIIGISLVIALINNLLKWQTEVQKKLKDAAKTAMNAGQAKSQFLAQMSHEIRTPINAVLGMNEMILRESNDKDIRDYSESIASAGRTLLNLINSILDFSKIEDGKMEIIPVRYNMLNMIDDLVNMIYERANKKNLSLITKIDPNLPRSLFGDDMRIKQVITNILTNAVKYTKQGTVTLTISSESQNDETTMLYVSVADTGIGIRAEDIAKLSQSFIRLDETKNRNIEGTGLGISIVKELLRMMGSQLEVESVYGKGSTFSFKLPQKIIDKTPIGTYGEHHTERKFKRVDSKDFIKAPRAKVLAVDDTSMNLKVINGLLKRNMIVPDLADSGEKCLQLAAKNFYHIIFLDHMMPVMDGVETFKRLKKMNLPAETKIVVLTANAISGAREKYLAWGFDDYLSKPIDVNALEEILAKYLPPDVVIRNEELGMRNQLVPNTVPSSKSLSSIDMKVAMANCMDSEEFWAEMVEEFLSSDKTAGLETAFKAEDWKEYQITTHALKSTALVIGAVDLSDKAKAQELAARDGKLDELKRNHANFMAAYKQIREELSKSIGKKDKPLSSIDMKVAMANCMDSEEFWAEMVEEFLSSDKTAGLETAFKAEDWKEYQITTHALKSTALVIGAVDLSERAKVQELAARDGKLEELKRNHANFMAAYKQVREELSKSIGKKDKPLSSIDMKVAMANCMDSEEFWAEMVEEFLSSDKTAGLETAFKAEDWKEYQITTHALKSTALVIGAVDLSDKAKVQELAARDGKFEELKRNHANFIATYKQVREELSKSTGKKDKPLSSIDMKVAMANCMDSEEFWAEMVEEFLSSDKTAGLETAFKAEDWKEYQITTHALKSTALVIGAVDLSDKAKVQELAARDGKLEELKRNHASFMATYKQVREELIKSIGKKDKPLSPIDMKVAMANCMDSEEFWAEMVEEFLSSDKTAGLESAFKAEDWKEYQITTHALKSTALVIGAVDLSDKAKVQELAARDGKLDELKRNHANFMATYKQVREELSKSIGKKDKPLSSIDMKVAMANCMDSEEFWAEMVEEFLSSDKMASLETAFKAEDWKEYQITTHALKSTALVIGAVDLSEKAKVQELAARDGKLEELKRNHASFMATYKQVREELSKSVVKKDKPLSSIDMKVAMANCMDSEEFWAEMVEEFLSSDKTAGLESAFKAEDWKEYQITTHALKSTALVIGAVDLSDKAKAQELAARDGKLDELKRNHASFMATYKQVREELSNRLEEK